MSMCKQIRTRSHGRYCKGGCVSDVTRLNERKQAITRILPETTFGTRHQRIQVGKLLGGGAFGLVFAGRLVMAQTETDVGVKVAIDDSGLGHEARFLNKLGLVVGTAGLDDIAATRGWTHLPLLTLYYTLNAVLLGRHTLMLVTTRYKICLSTAIQTGAGVDGVRVGHDILRGLEYLHTYLKDSTYYVHRDVASRNIMLDEHGRAYLIDFGSMAHYCDVATTPSPGAGYMYVRGHRRWIRRDEVDMDDTCFLYASRRTDVVQLMLVVMMATMDVAFRHTVWVMGQPAVLYTAGGSRRDEVCGWFGGCVERLRVHVMKHYLFDGVVALLGLGCADAIDYARVHGLLDAK